LSGGSRGTCKFNLDQWKSTTFYNEILSDLGKEAADYFVPKRITYYGTAPVCNISVCDVVKENKYVLGPTRAGDGKSCWGSGYKYAATDPITPRQIAAVKEMKKECSLEHFMDNQTAAEKWKALGKTADLVTTVMGGNRGPQYLSPGLRDPFADVMDAQRVGTLEDLVKKTQTSDSYYKTFKEENKILAETLAQFQSEAPKSKTLNEAIAKVPPPQQAPVLSLANFAKDVASSLIAPKETNLSTATKRLEALTEPPRKVCSYVPVKDKFCLVCRKK
jgi:hypothetical protein